MYDDLARSKARADHRRGHRQGLQEGRLRPREGRKTEKPRGRRDDLRDAFGVPTSPARRTRTRCSAPVSPAPRTACSYGRPPPRRGGPRCGVRRRHRGQHRDGPRAAAYGVLHPKEAAEQLEIIAQENGAEGERLLRGRRRVHRRHQRRAGAMCPLGLPTGLDCPAEYVALQRKPTPWTRADITYVASLVGGIFGKGGGQEYANSMFFGQLVESSAGKGRRDVRDLREKNDPEAPTTSTCRSRTTTRRSTRPGRSRDPRPDGATAQGRATTSAAPPHRDVARRAQAGAHRRPGRGRDAHGHDRPQSLFSVRRHEQRAAGRAPTRPRPVIRSSCSGHRPATTTLSCSTSRC